MKTSHIAMAAAAVGGMMIGGSYANAASVGDLIGNDPGTQVLLSDESRENVIDNKGGISGRINPGDSVTGVFEIDQLFVDGNQSSLRLSDGNNELTGEFQIQVTSKTRVSDGADGQAGTTDDQYQFTYGADPNFDTNGNGTLFRLYEDSGNSTYFNQLDSSVSNARSVVSDGDLFFGVGLKNSDNAIIGTGNDFINGIQPSTRLGLSFFALDVTENGIGSNYDLARLTNQAGTGAFIGSTEVGGPLKNSPWDLSNNLNSQFQLVPTPAALGLGLALFGGLFGTRRRKNA